MKKKKKKNKKKKKKKNKNDGVDTGSLMDLNAQDFVPSSSFVPTFNPSLPQMPMPTVPNPA